MTDDRNLSNDIGEDPEVDALFAAAGRFPVKMDFEDRVLRVVALPLPDWAIKVRNFKTALLQTRAGRLTLAGLTVLVVTSVTVTANQLWSNAHAIREWMGGWGMPSWSLRTAWNSVIESLASVLPASIANRSFALAAVAVVGVSAVGLYITAGPPALRGRHAR